MNTTADAPVVKRYSGRTIVVGIFGFAVFCTAFLWVYWKLHTGPFQPLQEALHAEFDGCSPRVEGGQRKMHKNTPHIFRLTLNAGFNPKLEEQRAAQMSHRVLEIASEFHDLNKYDTIELYLYFRPPERATVILEQEFSREEFAAFMAREPVESPSPSASGESADHAATPETPGQPAD